MKLTHVGVVGAGNIGAGVVTDLVLHGINAVVVDLSEKILEKAEAEVRKNIRFASLFSKSLPLVTREDVSKRLVLTTELKDVGSCDFVIENVTENWDIKKGVYEKLEKAVPPEVCFGANTSCISITQIASATRRPAGVVGMHFMNPVHLMATVEVIRGAHTANRTIDALLRLFSRLNEASVIVGDLPGFVSIR